MSDPKLTAEELNELEVKLKAAYPLPWGEVSGVRGNANRELVATAINALPALIAAARASLESRGALPVASPALTTEARASARLDGETHCLPEESMAPPSSDRCVWVREDRVSGKPLQSSLHFRRVRCSRGAMCECCRVVCYEPSMRGAKRSAGTDTAATTPAPSAVSRGVWAPLLPSPPKVTP